MATGIFNTGDFTTDHDALSFSSMITRLMPNGSAPLFGLTSQLQTETAVNVEHFFYTKTMIFPSMKLNMAGDAAAAVTTLVVDSTANVLPGMVFRVSSSGENILVTSVVSSTTVVVVRGLGTVSAATISNDGYMYQVGNAQEEASLRPQAMQIQPVRVSNYTQIFRNTWTISDTVRATKVIAGESNIAESRQDCAAFHATAIETALIFGQYYNGTRNGQPFRTMKGFISMVEDLGNYPSSYTADNSTTLGATTSYTDLETAIDPVFNQTTDPKVANERVMFVGGGARIVLNNIGRLNGTYQMVDGQTAYGLQFSTIKLARGTIRIIEHPLLNTNDDWKKMGLVVDLSTFRLAYLQGRQTKNEEFGTDGNPADNGQDAVGGTLTTELTCVMKNIPANAVLYNFTAAAAG